MRRVSLIVSVFALFWLAIPAGAQTPTDNYVLQLRELGYEDITISRTFLGRYKIEASRDGVTREMVVARNGQLLFDYFDADDKSPSVVNGIAPVAVPSDNSDDNVSASTDEKSETETEAVKPGGTDNGTDDETKDSTTGGTKDSTTTETDSDNDRDKGNNGNNGNGNNGNDKGNNGVGNGVTGTRG